MEVLLLAAVIVAVWLVLSHIRRQQFLKEYLELQRQALEKGVALPGDLKEFATAKTDWAAVSLRVGIISLVLGIMGFVIGMYILPHQPWNPHDADAAAIFTTFWAFGLLLVAFGVGNLICWLLIDKRRRGKTDKGK
jgi:uncharacterized membrane protein YfcA